VSDVLNREEQNLMRNLIKECAPWFNWKVAAVFVAAVVCIGFIVGADAGLLAVAGATPLLAFAACLIPCLIPLVQLRGKKQPESLPRRTQAGVAAEVKPVRPAQGTAPASPRYRSSRKSKSNHDNWPMTTPQQEVS
jgi:hypothetical protein